MSVSPVNTLPNAAFFRSHHYSGYLHISETKRIFYYFVESENDPLNDSIVFWMNGGPGM